MQDYAATIADDDAVGHRSLNAAFGALLAARGRARDWGAVDRCLRSAPGSADLRVAAVRCLRPLSRSSTPRSGQDGKIRFESQNGANLHNLLKFKYHHLLNFKLHLIVLSWLCALNITSSPN